MKGDGHMKDKKYLSFGYGYNEPRRNKPYYKTHENNVTTKCYCTWYNMMKRCYDPKDHDYETYKDCEVMKKWHNFQNFAEWWYENYYEIPNVSMSLDKDILVKDNRLYSPRTCCIVPMPINSVFKTDGKSNTKSKREVFEKYKEYLPQDVIIAIEKILWHLGGKKPRKFTAN